MNCMHGCRLVSSLDLRCVVQIQIKRGNQQMIGRGSMSAVVGPHTAMCGRGAGDAGPRAFRCNHCATLSRMDKPLGFVSPRHSNCYKLHY